MHDYNVHNNKNRFIYYYLSILSILISTLIPQLFQKITSITGITLSITITSAAIFSLLYFLFDHLLWKIKFFGIPNFSGDWVCTGKSCKYCEEIERDWKGIIHIKQTWKNILITLDTENSKSISISLSGSIIKLAGMGYKLHYLYSNEPKPNHKELHSHLGHCELIFSNDLRKAEGKYFTNQERKSFGSMAIRRK